MYLAQLVVEAISCYHNEDAICDALWLMNSGLGGTEEEWENFNATFKNAFEVTYDKAKKLNLF